MAICLVAAAVTAAVVVVLATAPVPETDRTQDLAERLRCPVCTSVSVAESPSESADAMRELIDEQVAAGNTDTEIEDYFRARYGDWAVIDPPATGNTLMLWVLPGVALVAGAATVLSRVAGRRDPDPPELSGDDRARVDEAVARYRRTATEPEDGV